jgi:hypothetical protein
MRVLAIAAGGQRPVAPFLPLVASVTRCPRSSSGYIGCHGIVGWMDECELSEEQLPNNMSTGGQAIGGAAYQLAVVIGCSYSGGNPVRHRDILDSGCLKISRVALFL